jgi:carbamoyl-phosphate synthase large subunit
MSLMLKKSTLRERLGALGFDTPVTHSAADWQELADDRGFPFVMKPDANSGGSRGVRLVKSPDEMREIGSELGDKLADYLVQEHVGSDDSEFTVSVLTDNGKNLIASIVIHRRLIGLSLKSTEKIDADPYSISSGISQGFIGKYPAISEKCKQLALSLDSRGPMNFQLRLHDGRPTFFEVHPRFSGSTSIRAEAGFNEPDVVLRSFLFGETFGRLDYVRDVVAIRSLEQALVPVSRYRDLGGRIPGEG